MAKGIGGEVRTPGLTPREEDELPGRWGHRDVPSGRRKCTPPFMSVCKDTHTPPDQQFPPSGRVIAVPRLLPEFVYRTTVPQ